MTAPTSPHRAARNPGCIVRDYTPADEKAWLRCRVLAFLDTPYYDDVRQTKPQIASPGFELVATDEAGTVLGVVDVTVEDDLATIDTIAVHPDHQHQGHGRALLTETTARARALSAGTLDAWTRDHPDTLRWYRAMGFLESDHYLHVYADHYTDPEEPDRAVAGRQQGLKPMTAFLHAPLNEEQRLRNQFARIHVCRRLTLAL